MPFICPGCQNIMDSVPSLCAKCNAKIVHCPKCRGTGQEVMANFFSPDQTQDVSIPCRKCGGRGVLGESRPVR